MSRALAAAGLNAIEFAMTTPGALTPTEAYTAWELGADAIKIFPAEFFGPVYIKSLRAPFPKLEFLPTGGVTPETVGDFLKAGAFAAADGSALVSAAALKSGDWAAITARAREFVAAANAPRARAPQTQICSGWAARRTGSAGMKRHLRPTNLSSLFMALRQKPSTPDRLSPARVRKIHRTVRHRNPAEAPLCHPHS